MTFVCRSALVVLIAITFVAAAPREGATAAATARLSALEAEVERDPENLYAAADYRQAAITAGAYDRAIDHLSALAKRRGAGPHVHLSLALAYIDKVPTAGAIRQIYLGRDAMDAATRAIAIEPTDVAYLIRGSVNLYYDRLVFHRVDKGVADLEQARRLSAPHATAPYVARIYVGLGDGYWRLDQPARARQVWGEGAALFPDSEALHKRLDSSDATVRGLVAQTLDANVRVDTTLHDLPSSVR